MIFHHVFVEEDIIDTERVKNILNKINKEPIIIDRYDKYWGKVKKPYLDKRNNLNLYLANKKGQLIKKAPHAYGINRGKHYYFIHQYNCIYECEYCYLQGHFNTPDIVMFVNHEDILKEMQSIVDSYPNEEIWFHAGEFSDSLALSHITKELPLYWEFFNKNSSAQLELRSKSVNVRELKKLAPLENIHISFTLSQSDHSKLVDLKTPPLKTRLKIIQELQSYGHHIGLHLDPIIYTKTFKEDSLQLIEEIKKSIKASLISYISLGVVRFTEDVYSEVKRNYPNSIIWSQKFNKGHDNKYRYFGPQTKWMLSTIENGLREFIAADKIYWCMEEND